MPTLAPADTTDLELLLVEDPLADIVCNHHPSLQRNDWKAYGGCGGPAHYAVSAHGHGVFWCRDAYMLWAENRHRPCGGSILCFQLASHWTVNPL